jgi:signal transduction histidine kinase
MLEHKIALLDSQHTLETATLNKKTKGDTLLNEQFYKIKTYSNQALSDVQNRNIFIVLVALVVLVFLYELIIRSIAGPLKETQEGLRELSNGVYRIPIHYRSKNELGKMMEALRTASVRLGFDIANEKKISNQIIKMHEQNQLLNAQVNQLQRLESIARITAGIAHNFNNSLGAIMGFNQLNQYAADDCQDETIKQEIIENTKQVEIASLRSMELVKQMMAYTNQNSAHKRNEFKPTSLVIEEVCNIVRLDLASNVKMESDIDHEVTIQIDADNLRQILTHIIFNARDAMQNQGGLIAMSLKKMIAHEFVCSSCLKTFNGVFIELRIQDNGTGIEEQIITHIFDPFFTLKPAGQGMGLGLTTVSGLVHEALGHIIVETNTTAPSNGTTFRLLFPQG